MVRAKPSSSKAKAKPRSSATSAKPSARANKPVATSKPTKSASAKSGAAKSGAAKSHVAKSAAKKSPAKPSPKRTPSPAETPRSRAPTISVRDETRRTRAPTASGRTRGEGAAPPPSDESRPRRDAVVEEPIDVAPHEATATSPRDHSAEAADPARAAELAALEEQVETLDDPHLLVALATRIDTLGMQLAYEISRHAHDAGHIAPLKPVLLRVPALYGKTLLRAAEKFDDQGSPRRAAYVLFEALRKAFDPDVITAVASALSFVLEAHGQAKPARTIRALLSEREDRRAAGVDRREVRTQFAAALEALRDGGVEWDALDDVADQFD